jgi:hypothetical protein
LILEVDDADAVIPQFGNEQALASKIEGHMIDAASNIAKGNLGFNAKSRLARLCKNSSRCSDKCADDRKPSQQNSLKHFSLQNEPPCPADRRAGYDLCWQFFMQRSYSTRQVFAE